jgi:hypothetical protein
MKTILRNTLLALLLFAWAGPLAAQNVTKEQLVVALSSPGKPGTLRVKLTNGSIRVEGYNGKDVVIEVANRGRSRDKDDDRARASADESGMRRISQTQGLEIVAEEKDNQVQIKTQSHVRTIDLVVKVPRQFSLRIGTVNDGDVVVSNVAGELEVSNVNGSIRLDDVAGSAVLNTVNGSITAKFRDVTDNAPMAFSSVNGKIDVTLPPKTKAGVKLKSDRGEIYSDFDLAVDSSAPKATRTAKDGTYRVTVESWTYGKINGGGAELMMKTLNGNIYIRRAK